MRGILQLAYKLLVNDKAKFRALLVGLTFAVFLMVQMTALFAGILKRASATVFNLGASIWVMDPSVQTVANTIGLPDYVLPFIRSLPGVKYAVPVYSGVALVKLADGTFQPVQVIGLDDATLVGRPPLIEGNIQDIYAENGFIVVKDAEYSKLESPRIGTEFEMNDHRGLVVGIAEVASGGLFGIPTLYTTYNRALQYIPNPRFTISYVLIEVWRPEDIAYVKREVHALGYLTLTKDEFVDRISDFYKYQTGVGTNILIMTVLSFIVGMSISGQTFYSFVLENIEKFGALKAMGAKNRELVLMIFFQSSFTALTGYGLGLGACTLVIAAAKLRLPDYAALITYRSLVLAFVMVVVIAIVSSYFAGRRVLRIEPFDIFRG